MGSPEAIRRAAEIAKQAAAERPVLVVSSAMSKVTDLLLDTMRLGEEGEEEALQQSLSALERNHLAAARELLPEESLPAVEQRIRDLVAAFGRTAAGMLMLGERPARSVDEAVSTGEKLSCLLLAETLCAIGCRAEAVSGSDAIVTDAGFGAAAPLTEETAEKARALLTPRFESGLVPIVTGFNAATKQGVPTTLGRGGSDFSASILAAALDAGELWIWTDVDGILTGDPRVVDDVRILADVTYNEAAELAYNGAKVLHPATLTPLIEKDIPVRIKNSFRPEAPGTRISSHVAEANGVRAITSMPSVTLISIEAVSLTMSGAQLMARALEAAARAKVDVLLLTRSSFRQNFCMLIRTEDVEAVIENLREELALELAHGYVHPIEIDHSVGLLATVGEGMKGTPGLAGRLFASLSERGINIIAIAQGSSELTTAVVILEEALQDAVRAVHAACRLGEPSRQAIRS